MARECQGIIKFVQNGLLDELQSDDILGMVSDLRSGCAFLGCDRDYPLSGNTCEAAH